MYVSESPVRPDCQLVPEKCQDVKTGLPLVTADRAGQLHIDVPGWIEVSHLVNDCLPHGVREQIDGRFFPIHGCVEDAVVQDFLPCFFDIAITVYIRQIKAIRSLNPLRN